jgi:PAS domain S-box-containing protein
MRSINTRITFYALAIFVVSLWSLTLYTSTMLRDDMQVEFGKQQFSTVTLVAEDIDHELTKRFFALKKMAEKMMLADWHRSNTLQKSLTEDPLFLDLFNGGAFVTDRQGTALASMPLSAQRVGINYLDRTHVVSALREGKTGISEPVMGRALKLPVVSISMPVYDARGLVMGALVGVTILNSSNFLDRVIGHHYGATGGFLLIDSTNRRIVTATDQRQVLQPLAAVGANPLNDRFAQGYEGFGVDRDTQGIEHLSAACRIPASHWYAVALLPTEEAFAPIRRMQQHMLAAAALFTLLAGGLIWWLLRRELAPLRNAATELSGLDVSANFPQALHNPRTDEIGQLIGAFNRLLETLRKRDQALQESEERFRTLVEWTPQAIAVHTGGKFVYANPATVRILQAASEADIVGQPVLRFVHPDFQALVIAQMEAVNPTEGTIEHAEYQFITVQGNCIDVEGKGTVIQYQGKPVRQLAFTDITERNAVERRLRQLSRITEQAPLAIVITKLNGEIEYVNPMFEEVTGYAFDELRGLNPRVLQSGLTPKTAYSDLWKTLHSGRVWRGEFTNRKKNGELFVEQATLAPVTGPDGSVTHYVGLKEDITQDKQRQRELEDLMQAQKTMLDEKTALLNEVHHRVKNNLQVITSLLRLEEGRAAEALTQVVLRDMQGRIRSMALVHETLYRTGTFAAVELHSYLQQVASNAFRAQVQQHSGIELQLDLQAVKVGINQATPCGLLVNELMSNALKHAFAPDRDGVVKVSLTRLKPDDQLATGLWNLCVADNGRGLPMDFAARRQRSLGLQLVSDLAKQLKGELHIRSENGASFTLVFAI